MNKFELDGYQCVLDLGRYVSTMNRSVVILNWNPGTEFMDQGDHIARVTGFFEPYARLSVNTQVVFGDREETMRELFVLRYYSETERLCYELIKRGFIETFGPSVDVGGYVGALPVGRLTEEGKKYVYRKEEVD